MSLDIAKIAGPAIHAINPWMPGNPTPGSRHQLLSADERAELAKISSIVRFRKGEIIYRKGADADASFNIIDGVVTAYLPLSRRRQHILAFLYPGDVFGLSEEGRYTSSTRATTAVTAYKIPFPALRRLLSKNASLSTSTSSSSYATSRGTRSGMPCCWLRSER